jgi:hypothetical protein
MESIMAPSRNQIHDEQDRHGFPPPEFTDIINRAVLATLEQLGDRPIPVRARALRTEAAARYISVDPDTMVQWRRDGKGPIFKKLGSRCIYLVESLDRFLDGLPIGNKNAVERADA